MGAIDKIDSIYDLPALTAQQKSVEDLVKKTVAQIKAARKESIEFNVGTKSFDEYNKKIKELEKTLAGMQRSSAEATKASILLAKQKEAEAKATIAQTKATEGLSRAQERHTRETEKTAKATAAAAAKATEARRPYQQLAVAFQFAARHAQDLAAKYGIMDKRAQAAAKHANDLNNRLKAIDDTVGISNRRVGSYTQALDGFGQKLKGYAANFLALIGVVGVGSIFKDSIDEFVEMDKNVRILQNTLRNQGVPEAFDRIEAAAKRLAKQFTYLDDDDILKVFNQLLVYGKLTEDQMNELIPVIIDFAAATGQDLNSATSVIIKALEGNGKALKEYGINIKDAKNTSEAFGLIMTQLAPKVAGVGKAFGDSSAGGLASAQQRFKDLKEEIGSGLLPVLNSVLGVLVKIGQGAIGAGRALSDAFSGKRSFVASILETSDNEDISREAEQIYKFQIKILDDQQKQLKRLQSEGKKLGVTEQDLTKEFIAGLKKRVDARQLEYEKIKQGTNKDAIMSAIADIRGLQRALQDLDKTPIKPTGDANKNFTASTAKKLKEEKDVLSQIKKDNIELDKEFDLLRFNNEKLSYEERLSALIAFGNDSTRLINFIAETELKKADLTKDERIKIENDKNNALIRLSQDLADKLAKVTGKEFGVDTTGLSETVSGLPKSIQKALDDFKKFQDAAIAKHKDSLKKLKEDTKEAILNLASELQGLFFDIFTNNIEREKNAIQDQIDLLEAQKQKEIELADQTITNAQDKADAIAVIEARAAAKRQQLELKQRQLDQQKARFEKARAVAEIIQSTTLAVVNALTQVKTLGPGAIALAAVIGALGAVHIARIIAQPIPRYKEGTQNHPGGLAVVGDGGKSEGIQLPDGTVYKTPSTTTVVDMPQGSKVYKDYSNMRVTNNGDLEVVDTRAELKEGFSQVVKAIKRIPQPIIHAERAWTRAHKTGSTFRNYLNQRL